MSRRSRPGSSCRAASTSTGSASAVTWSGRCWVPAASTWAWATDSSPSHTAWAVSVSGPRNRARAVRTCAAGRPVAQMQPVAQPGRGRPDLLAGFGAGGAEGVDPGQFLEPLAVQPIHHPSQLQDPLGPDNFREPVQVPGGQPVQEHGQLGQVVWLLDRLVTGLAGSNVCSSPWGQPIKPPAQGKHQTQICGQPFRVASLLDQGSARAGRVIAYLSGRGNPRIWRVHGAEQPDPPCQATERGSRAWAST